jgi:hypothetical protein
MSVHTRQPCQLIVALCLGWTGTGLAQLVTPSTNVVVPPVGRTRVEIEFSWYRPEAFVDAFGSTQRFPGSLGFGLAIGRASYSPLPHLALGVVAPYRWTRLDIGQGGPSLSSTGNTGLGLFVDWARGPCRGHALCPSARLGYYRARTDANPVITISDGIDRVFAFLQIASASPTGSDRWQEAGTLYLDSGWPTGITPRQFDARLQLELGHVLVRTGTSDLWLFALAGYRDSTSATEEDMFFHEGTSSSGFAGLRLNWRLDQEIPERRIVSLSVTRDFRPDNALVGWRGGISFATTL